MVESIYFLKPAWCGTHLAGLWPEQDFQSVTVATAFRRWFSLRTRIMTDSASFVTWSVTALSGIEYLRALSSNWVIARSRSSRSAGALTQGHGQLTEIRRSENWVA